MFEEFSLIPYLAAGICVIIWIGVVYLSFRWVRGRNRLDEQVRVGNRIRDLGWSEARMRELTEQFPRNGTAMRAYLDLLVKRGAQDEALARARDFIARNRGELSAHLLLADMLARAGERAESERVIARAGWRWPGHSELLLRRARAAARRGDHAAALRLHARLRRRGFGPQPYLAAITSLEALGRIDAAAGVIAEGLRKHPDASWMLTAQARFAARHGRLAEALAAWERLRQLQPGQVDAYVEPAGLLAANGREAEARAIAAEAREIFRADDRVIKLWKRFEPSTDQPAAAT
ncbi:Tetratricopeptide repeat protein [Rhodovastum atsumiense]|uniref:Tetratricopeptide repeat protein n=1 Tax=Rhodovastum atsumiense TaxID=504468 RepID=A0A5M6IKA8_9PROT|nr:tetratricopeptide repeat protein [Rhodovastum atsumiense]KAA5608696.1 tetratricopeptide repeat protein [Rhodovastum atsumiense]CAH2599110.1 Tetratricopeptide repeat protein [Rhodovastum atsumiense]